MRSHQRIAVAQRNSLIGARPPVERGKRLRRLNALTEWGRCHMRTTTTRRTTRARTISIRLRQAWFALPQFVAF
jgi:hypothetical protein